LQAELQIFLALLEKWPYLDCRVRECYDNSINIPEIRNEKRGKRLSFF